MTNPTGGNPNRECLPYSTVCWVLDFIGAVATRQWPGASAQPPRSKPSSKQVLVREFQKSYPSIVAEIAIDVRLGRAFCAVFLCQDRILTAGGRWLNVSTPINQEVDDVFVLGGEVELRPLAAAAIIRAGLGKRVLVPQVVATPEVSLMR